MRWKVNLTRVGLQFRYPNEIYLDMKVTLYVHLYVYVYNVIIMHLVEPIKCGQPPIPYSRYNRQETNILSLAHR